MTAVIDLEELPVTSSVDFLREHMLHAPVPLELVPDPTLPITVRSRSADLGAVHLLVTRAQGGDIVRTRRLARDSTHPSLMVSVIGSGVTRLAHAGRRTLLHSGDVGLYLTDRPYAIGFTPGAERITFQVPLDQLDLPRDLIDRRLLGPMGRGDATSAGVSGFLRGAGRHGPASTSLELAALEQPLLQMIRLLLTRAVADTALGRAAAAESLGTRVEEHVRARLMDPDLSARSIAEAFAISERYAYLILERRGLDLGDLIRQHRLERAARLLAQCPNDVTVSAIAQLLGFADHSHFSRAFRAHFGMTPTQWRQSRRPRQ